MKEGNTHEDPETDYSLPMRTYEKTWSADNLTMPSLKSMRPASQNVEVLDAEAREVKYEQEAMMVENSLPSQSSLTSNEPLNALPSYQATPKRRPKQIHCLHLHTSNSEIFNTLSRSESEEDTRGRYNTTYSSLPPSPTAGLLNTPTEKGVLSQKSLEEFLHSQVGLSQDESDSETELIDKEIWPQRSERATVEDDKNNERDGMSVSPGISASSASPDSPSATSEGIHGRGQERNLLQRGETLGMWDLLKDEMESEDWDEWIVGGKWFRIANFLAVPLAVEKTILFGALLCLDGFLYNFTVLPIRAVYALSRTASGLRQNQAWWPIPIAHVSSMLRMLLLVIPTVVLLIGTDASKMYHTVRGQDTIKLYVIFNALEIADRLCGAFGQDVLDTLFAKETLSPSVRKLGKGRKRQQARPAFFFALSLGYVLLHSLIFFYMLVSLNVAINSYDYTLLSLLISNQFVEIKGSVFKKFEKENLFQIMCADIVERFQLSLMLTVIAIRNVIEMSGSEIAFLPKSFMRGKSLVESILSPVLFVILSEMVVDWLKHAFITKFNHVRASVYERFTDVLAKDVLLAGHAGSRYRFKGRNHRILLDQSPLVARRLGFASIPLACLVIRISFQAIGMLTSHHGEQSDFADCRQGGYGNTIWWGLKVGSWMGLGICVWGCLVFLKIMLGLSLLGYSAMRQEGMNEREAHDRINDFGRSAVGESQEETRYNRLTTEYLSRPGINLPQYPAIAAYKDDTELTQTQNNRRNSAKEKIDDENKVAPEGKKGKKWRLEEVERWTMVKRIW
nr:hypothetical protein L203_03499 [Cryptococcus depauperatus CBS 7841]